MIIVKKFGGTSVGDKEGFDIGFETLFLGIVDAHIGTSLLPVTYS